jgi:hypothetical protein
MVQAVVKVRPFENCPCGAGVKPVISDKIDLKAGTATQLSITTKPLTTVQSGEKFDVDPEVQLLDAGGNNAKQNKVIVTVSTATGEGTLSGNLTVDTDNSGTA